jgi:NitT/TauT family transport system permease protein
MSATIEKGADAIDAPFFVPIRVWRNGFCAAGAWLLAAIPVAILTASGVRSVSRAYYDVARTLGADNRFLVLRVAIPAALPNVFVDMFMGLYYSFAVLVIADMLGAKYGLGWYLQFQTA